jgi:hypothetical protein
VTRTVLRSEVLTDPQRRAAGSDDHRLGRERSSASAEFLAAFAARVMPVSMLMLARKPDEEAAAAAARGRRDPGRSRSPLPVALEALRSACARLLRQRRLGSTTTREPLPGLVRRIQGERGSFTLHVNAGTEYGSLTFVDGVLVDAQNARRTGERAALEILGWRQTSVGASTASCRSRRRR